MIVCKELNRSFESKEKMFEALKANKVDIIAQKKMITKEADPVVYTGLTNTKEAIKNDSTTVADVNTLKAELVINTTKVMDSHSDVHLDGIWNKSVNEQKNLYLLQEHKMSFSNIITDKVIASVKSLPWSSLGTNYKGNTEALVFNVEIPKDRNTYMFGQYAKGFVKNHSVGMRYVKLDLALNSDNRSDAEEKDVWDKHIDSIANKEDVIAQGYFWAVSEAKVIEGSAVPVGSNQNTPVLNIESKEAANSTSNIEPSNDTHKNGNAWRITDIY